MRVRAVATASNQPTHIAGFDSLLCEWLDVGEQRIGERIAAQIAKHGHPVEVPCVLDSLADVLRSRSLRLGSGDFFDATAACAGAEARDPGAVDPGVRWFFVLAPLFQLSGDVPGQLVFAQLPLSIAFRLGAEGSEQERRRRLAAVEAAHESLRTFVDWNGARRVDAAAMVNLGRVALLEAMTGVRDDEAVGLVAEELDRVQPPGFSLLFLEQGKRRDPTGWLFLDALEAMLGERWGSPAWQMVRHVLVKPRRW